MDHGHDTPMDSQYMDYAEHERTYARFIGLTKWVAGFVVVLLILMAYFLV